MGQSSGTLTRCHSVVTNLRAEILPRGPRAMKIAGSTRSPALRNRAPTGPHRQRERGRHDRRRRKVAARHQSHKDMHDDTRGGRRHNAGLPLRGRTLRGRGAFPQPARAVPPRKATRRVPRVLPRRTTFPTTALRSDGGGGPRTTGERGARRCRRQRASPEIACQTSPIRATGAREPGSTRSSGKYRPVRVERPRVGDGTHRLRSDHDRDGRVHCSHGLGGAGLPTNAHPAEGLCRHHVGLGSIPRGTGGAAARARCAVAVLQRRSGSSLLVHSHARCPPWGWPCARRPRLDHLELALAPERWHRPLLARRSTAHHTRCLRRRPAPNLHWCVPDLVRPCGSLHERSCSAVDASLRHPGLHAQHQGRGADDALTLRRRVSGVPATSWRIHPADRTGVFTRG